MSDQGRAARELAACLSITNVVDPYLVRRMRFDVVPWATSEAEARLWAGPFVETTSADRLMFDPDWLPVLRAELVADPERLAAAQRVIRDAHSGLGPTVALEDELIWLGATAPHDAAAIDDRLRRIARTLADLSTTPDPGRTTSLARWIGRVLPSLPAAVTRSPGAGALAEWARHTLDLPTIASGGVADLGEWRVLLDEPTDTRRIGVRLSAGGVELSPRHRSAPPSHPLEVPDTAELRLDIASPGSDALATVAVDVAADATTVELHHLALLTGDGDLTMLGPHVGEIRDVAAGGSPDRPIAAILGADGLVSIRRRSAPSIEIRAPGTEAIALVDVDRVGGEHDGEVEGEGWVAVTAGSGGVAVHDLRSGARRSIVGDPATALVTARDGSRTVAVLADGRYVRIDREAPGGAVLPTGDGDTLLAVSGLGMLWVNSSDVNAADRLVWRPDAGEPIVGPPAGAVERALLTDHRDDPVGTAVFLRSAGAWYVMGVEELAALDADPDQQPPLGEPAAKAAQQLLTSARSEATPDAWDDDQNRVLDPHDSRVRRLAPGGELVPEPVPSTGWGFLHVLDDEVTSVEYGEVGTPMRLPGRRSLPPALCTAGAVLVLEDAPVEVRSPTGERLVVTPLPTPDLGARVGGDGTTRFAVATSESAERVDLCLFRDPSDTMFEERIEMTRHAAGIWRADVDVGAGVPYGYRVHGPIEAGHNAAKLLIDPWASAVTGELEPVDGLALRTTSGSPDPTDTAPFVPRSVTCPLPTRPLSSAIPVDAQSVLYEVHVKGPTMLVPSRSDEHRPGTYGRFADVMVDHLTELGVTHVLLLPVAQFVHSPSIRERGLNNYWGFDPIAPFAPHADYADGTEPISQVAEFREMVDRLHDAGIGVIVWATLNHTAEAHRGGPTLSMRGLDEAAYYRLTDDGTYLDLTGTGHVLDTANPRVQHLVLGALRHWVTAYGIDGFMLDLAATYGRDGADDFSATSPMLELVRQDPVVGQRFLGVEPWDIGAGGDQQGRFPAPFVELDGRFRDRVRDWWRSAATRAEMADALTGNPSIFDRRNAIRFVAMHDGFTLRDLTTYDERHNEDNGERNRDGQSDNRSWNCGVEGPTDDREVVALRARQQRNLIATQFLAPGTTLLLGGDEIGRTQRGNNNAYCQDNELSWFDWDAADEGMKEFVRALIEFRHSHPLLAYGMDRAEWFGPDGGPLADEDWDQPGPLWMWIPRTNASDEATSLLAGLFPTPGHTSPTLPWTESKATWDLVLSTDPDSIVASDAQPTGSTTGSPPGTLARVDEGRTITVNGPALVVFVSSSRPGPSA